MKKRLGILGGGQLGRMLALSARPLGLQVTALDPSANAPAEAAAQLIVGDYEDQRALALLSRSDWVTFEFENVPDRSAEQLAQTTRVAPPPEALRVAQDRLLEKATFRALGIPTADFVAVDSLEEARGAFARLGSMILKTRRLGYDGKGQARVSSEAHLEQAFASLAGAPAIAEAFVPFERELSVIVCRGYDGQNVVYPLTENLHEQGMLRKSIAPAPGLTRELLEASTDMALRLAEHLNYIGVLALELFQVNDQLIANEFAPRVHNSGHWTIEGCVTSQFENHVRAVVGLPLGCTSLRRPAVMLNLIGQMPPLADLLAIQDCHVHDYEKSPRDGRKVGHVTCLGETPEVAKAKADLVAALIARQRD